MANAEDTSKPSDGHECLGSITKGKKLVLNFVNASARYSHK